MVASTNFSVSCVEITLDLTFVANDVLGSVVVWVDVAVVLILWNTPSNDRGRRVRVLHAGVVALIVDVVGNPSRGGTVSSDADGESAD